VKKNISISEISPGKMYVDLFITKTYLRCRGKNAELYIKCVLPMLKYLILGQNIYINLQSNLIILYPCFIL